MSEVKTVTDAHGETYALTHAMRGFSCHGCLKDLTDKDLVAACPDCGAILCEDCVAKGALTDHVCDDEEADD